MLFNSIVFIFLFLPAALAAYFLVGKKSGWKARGALSVFSFVFYAYWDYSYLPLLLISISANFILGIGISREVEGAGRRRLLWCGLFFNIALLFWYKYAGWLYSIVWPVVGSEFLGSFDVVLPIGISFFTFTQIAFLVDCYKVGVKEYRFWDYALFVSYFPHQIAGPILHHKEMMDQFRSRVKPVFDFSLFWVGLSVFTIGLAKKLFLADVFDTYASPVFSAAEGGASVSFFEVWGAALSYTLQLYFDFSAYSDMAIGISLMFGIRLPLNFYSPYKSRSIIDFWRRWHMTLSRFLRDYLYIPLGGSRLGVSRRYINLMITMVLGGLWHGASLTFVLWGALHGFYLCLNHFWRRFIGVLGISPVESEFIRKLLGAASWGLTFVAVVVAWVFFRAESPSAALKILSAMFVPEYIYFPVQLRGLLPADFLYSQDWSGAVGGVRSFLLIGFGLLICFFAPNVSEIFSRFKISLDQDHQFDRPGFYPFRFNAFWGGALGLLFGLLLTRLGGETVFLYFNF